MNWHECGCGGDHGPAGAPAGTASIGAAAASTPGPRVNGADAGAAVEYDRVSFGYAGANAAGRNGAGQGAEEDAPNAGADGLVLKNISLRVKPGERLGILGPNGGGKSTLLKLTLGLLKGYSGRIAVMGMTPEQARRARVIGYVPQRIEAELRFPVSARQVVAMGASVGLAAWRGVDRERRETVEESLRVVGASAFAERAIGELSGGQAQRVMIARALACRPKILLLDEPTVGIDVRGQQQFADLLARLHDELGLTIIVVSHDLRTVAAGCDRVACLSRTLHYHVAPEGLTPAVLAEVFRHDVAAIFGDLHVDAHQASACKDPSHGQ